jgi:predicted NUDIX family phosphoesterase
MTMTDSDIQTLKNPVLTIPRTSRPDLPKSGAWPWRVEDAPADWLWLERARAETDESHLQIIPYAALQNAEGMLWTYRRAGGDARLRERWSAGVGGHIEAPDAAADLAAMAERALRRELCEELGFQPDAVPAPSAWLYEGFSPIGRVHLGLLHVLPWRAAAPPRPAAGEALRGLGFVEAARIQADERFELWSRLAAHCIETGKP